ncbi:MAG: hypothetical protein R2748_00520 [Bryobacterales bacterium]
MESPVLGQIALGGPGEVNIAVADGPARRRIEPPENVEQSRLTAAGGPEQDDQLAFEQIEIHAA